uniref:ribulose-1,5-bisphosphate carboxylase/oxygenase small subunit n=1 Tax=Rhodaphanes brevistipitata TaxID=446136 RepID=UPI001FCD06BA|nr:ribulose-1,5-bisphosphate carboxylase/oxygenase small subunit [Rhodaphanes brevistipitata]UNJ18389.1 ribulose-1,5-bisphosphate carboxylase/oxygenase small subunit [Rhodaphanes brevistipitata]
MRLTQGTFSYLPDLTEEQIAKQIRYAMIQGYSMSIEYTDDPHPRNSYWDMWGLPLFDIKDPSSVTYEIAAARKAHPNVYVKINAFDNTRGVESCKLSFIIQRPAAEPGFLLTRQEVDGRLQRYSIHSYATEKPEGNRY